MLSLPPTRVDAAFPQRRQTHTHLSSSAADIKKGFPPEYMLRKTHSPHAICTRRMRLFFTKCQYYASYCPEKASPSLGTRRIAGIDSRATISYAVCAKVLRGNFRYVRRISVHLSAAPLYIIGNLHILLGAYIPSQMKDFPCFEKFRPTMRLISSQHCTVESVQGKTVILPLPKMLS